MITLAEVIEQCAKACDKRAKRDFPWASENSDRYHAQADWAEQCAKDIRALAAQYENCIVADGSPAARTMGVLLYCAKEPTK